MIKRSLWAAALMAAAMFAACDDDDSTNPPVGEELRDLNFFMNNMGPHLGQYMEFRVVSDSTTLRSRAIIDTLIQPNESFRIRNVLGDSDYQFDFWADLSGNGSYDTPPTDHAWRLDPPDEGDATVTFQHNTDFTDIGQPALSDSGNTFTLNLVGFTPHVGQMLEVHVIEESNGWTVGFYRMNSVDGADISVVIPGVIRNSVNYRADFFADLNGNRQYDDPPTDHAWRLTGTGNNGLTLTMTHNTDFTDIGLDD